ncbi:MAG: sigma-70 family RNA polymerase sigma factor [Phycisphaerales bacterium]
MSVNQGATTHNWLSAAVSLPHSPQVQSKVRSLTEAIASGNTEAFATFYRQWFDTMYAQARSASGRDESFCLDVVQDAMLRVIKSVPSMTSSDDLRRWLRVVVQSCAYDRFREETRRKAREQRAVAVRALNNSNGEVEADENTVDRIRWLEHQLQSLDDRDLQLLLMRHRFGWTLKRIGQTLGMKPGAVDGRIRRVLSKLRRRAKEQSDE